MNKLEPGYYSDESGQKKYWDGSQWLIPEASASRQEQASLFEAAYSEPKIDVPRKPKKPLLVIGLALGLLVLFGVIVNANGMIYSPDNSNTGVVENTDTKSNETIGQANARQKAEQYLRTMPFSQKGLVKQLMFEGFSEPDSNYAVGVVRVDWNDQAAKKAQQYLDIMAYSRDGLVKQLEFEGFTSSEAEYGVTAVGY